MQLRYDLAGPEPADLLRRRMPVLDQGSSGRIRKTSNKKRVFCYFSPEKGFWNNFFGF